MHISVRGSISQQTCFLLYKYLFAGVKIARRCFPDDITCISYVRVLVFKYKGAILHLG